MALNKEQIESNKAEVIGLLRQVKRDGIEKLIEWLDKKSDFFTAPSSTVFHGNYEGGLCEHSLNVYHALVRLKNAMSDMTLEEKKFDNIKDGSLIIVALLHDICKSNYYTKEIKYWKDENASYNNQWKQYYAYTIDDKFPVGHGEKSVIMLQNFITLKQEEILAIRWHMTAYDPAVTVSPYEKPAFNKAMTICPLLVLLSMADVFAAQLMEKAGNPKIDNAV